MALKTNFHRMNGSPKNRINVTPGGVAQLGARLNGIQEMIEHHPNAQSKNKCQQMA